MAFGVAVLVTLLVNLALHWPFGRLYALMFVITAGLVIWQRRAGSRRAQQEMILKRLEQGEIERPEAEQLFRAAGFTGKRPQNRLNATTQKVVLKHFQKGTIEREEAEWRLIETGLEGQALVERLNETARKAIVERMLDRAIDRAEARRRLLNAGVGPGEVDAYLIKWTESLILLRYVRHEINYGQAQRLLREKRNVTETRANEILSDVDRLLAIEQQRIQRQGW